MRSPVGIYSSAIACGIVLDEGGLGGVSVILYRIVV